MRVALPVSQGKPVLQGAPVFRGTPARQGRCGLFLAQVWALGTAEGTICRDFVPSHVPEHGWGHVLPQKRDPARAKGSMRYARALIRR